MKKSVLMCAAALCLSATMSADNEPTQTLTINGVKSDKKVQSITFDGDNVQLTFTDGTTESTDMEAVIVAFESDPTSISISSVEKDGSETVVYDINGRMMRSAINELPAGIYIIKSATKTVKFIKK